MVNDLEVHGKSVADAHQIRSLESYVEEGSTEARLEILLARLSRIVEALPCSA